MWLIAMKGMAGCGKSTLARALSRELGWPLIDKDDIKDLLDGHAQASGPLSYAIMFNIEKARSAARETHASLAIIECICSDESRWMQRIDDRKRLPLPAHHQTDWEAYQLLIQLSQGQEQHYPITHPHLVVDTVQSLDGCLTQVTKWLMSSNT